MERTMVMEYTDMMVDIETTGLQPDRNAVIQIGAVKFNLEKRTVCPQTYKASLTIPPYRHWNQGTAAWWAGQPKEIMNEIITNQRPYAEVLEEFQQWSLGGYRFWSKPSHFDFMFLASSFEDAGLANPFSYRVATDMNSFILGLYGGNEVPPEIEANVSVDGPAHDALNDCWYQLKTLFAHLENTDEK